MKIKRIRIENFVRIEEADLELEEDVYFVVGQNKDENSAVSNGAGKSLLCETIPWALFDDLLRKDMLKDDVIGPFKDYASVEIQFIKGGNIYVVHRTRNHPVHGNGVILFQNEVDISKHKDKDTNRLIEKIIGVDKNVAYYSSYVSEQNSILSLSPSEILTVFNEVLDISQYDKIVKTAHSYKKQLESDLISLEKDKHRADKELGRLESYSEKLREDLVHFHSDIKDKISSLRDEVVEINENLADTEDLLELKPKIELKAKLAKKEVDKYDKIHKRIARIDNKLDAARRKRTKAKDKLSSIISARDELQSAYDNLANNPLGKCNYCGNALAQSNEISERIEDINSKLDERKVECIDYEVELEKVESKIRQLKKKKEEQNEKLDSYNEIVKDYEKWSKKLSTLDELDRVVKNSKERRAKVIEEIESLRNAQPDRIQKMINENEEELKEVEQELTSVIQSMNKTENKIKCCEEIKTGVRDYKDGVFNYFMKQFSNLLNQNLSDMTSGDYEARVKIDGKGVHFSFTNTSKRGEFKPFSIFSKGERVRILKSFYVSLNEIFGSDFLIDDEGINGLDSSVSDVLDFVLSKKHLQTLFFVGHQSDLKDYLRTFPTLVCTKENGKISVEAKNA